MCRECLKIRRLHHKPFSIGLRMMHMTHPTSAEDALDIAHESRETAKLSAGFPALLYFSL